MSNPEGNRSLTLAQEEFPELASLLSLRHHGVNDLYGAPIDLLVKNAEDRLVALKLLLEAEQAFDFNVDGESDDSPIVEAERKCEEARAILVKKVRYPADERFAIRHKVLQADITRAESLKAALQRWREVLTRTNAISGALAGFERRKSEQYDALTSVVSRITNELEERQRHAVQELELLKDEATKKKGDLDERLASIQISANSLGTNLDALRELSETLLADLREDQKEEEDWDSFVVEVIRLYQSLAGVSSTSLAPATMLAALSGQKERLAPPWRSAGDALIQQIGFLLDAQGQGFREKRLWECFCSSVREFPQAYLKFGLGGVLAEVNAIIAEAEALLENEEWPAESVLRKAAETMLADMITQRNSAQTVLLEGRIREADYWLDQAEALSESDPPSALACLARVRTIVVDREPLESLIPAELVSSFGSLKDRLQSVQAKARSFLPDWLSRQRVRSLKEVIEELRLDLEEWRRGRSSEALGVFLYEREERRRRDWVDEIIIHSFMIPDLGLADFEPVVRQLVQLRQVGLAKSHKLLREVRSIEQEGDRISSKEVRNALGKIKQAGECDPDSPEIQDYISKFELRWKGIDDGFKAEVQKAYAANDGNAVDPSDKIKRILRKVMREFGGREIEEWSDELRRLEEVQELWALAQEVRREDRQREVKFAAFVKRAEQQLKYSARQPVEIKCLRSIVESVRPRSDDRPSDAYRWILLTEERG